MFRLPRLQDFNYFLINKLRGISAAHVPLVSSARDSALFRDARSNSCVFRLLPLARDNVVAQSGYFAWRVPGRRNFLRLLEANRPRAKTRAGAQPPVRHACL